MTQFDPTSRLAGVSYGRLNRIADVRGSFTEIWRSSAFGELGIGATGMPDARFVQANLSTSAQGVLDLHNTPVSEVYPGIEVHASLLSGLLDNRIKAKPQYESVVNGIILAAIGLPLAMLLRRFGPLLSAVITAGVALAKAAAPA